MLYLTKTLSQFGINIGEKMIILENKLETTSSSSPLSLSSSEEEPKVSFSELLKGANLKKDDKVIQNGAMILALDGDKKVIKEDAKSIKKDTLLSLLKTDKKVITKDSEPLELNPKIIQNLSVKEVKTLIAGAKEYLKEKILQSDGFKDVQIKELPKTLKGLSALAKKIGIDISKITIEEVQTKIAKPVLNTLEPKRTLKEEVKLQVQSDVKELKSIPKEQVALKQEVKLQVKGDAKELKSTPKEQVVLKEEVKLQVKSTPKEQVALKEVKTRVEPKNTLKEEVKLQVQSDVRELKNTPKEQVVPKDVALNEVKKKVTIKADDKNQAIQIVEDKKIDAPKQAVVAKETPLFKAQIPKEHTTEQLVATKAFKVEEKTPKVRADETLKLLLRGEKLSHTNSALTADFSVATARVIAPTATSEAVKSLESLLHGESSESSTTSKTDGLSTLKADSFEVKLNEAKQMIKYLSSDVKTAIEDYKSPFTRVKVQLNPQKLGEIDLTIVQRGKNLHISLSSNSAAINTLSLNANELRAQLSNNGIHNTSLNFSNNSQGENQNHQQNRQNEQREATQEYSFFENEEQNEEILSSLEILVPNYA